MLVLDASVVVPYLTRAEEQERVERALGDALDGSGLRLHAPALIDLEVLHTLRRQTRHGEVSPARAERALARLRRARLVRMDHSPLIPRIWALRDNLSAYDAAYVALAEILGATLLTFDRRLAASTGHRATVVVP